MLNIALKILSMGAWFYAAHWAFNHLSGWLGQLMYYVGVFSVIGLLFSHFKTYIDNEAKND